MLKMKYVFVLFSLFLSSCFLTPYETSDDDGLPGEGGDIALVSDLFEAAGLDEYGRRITSFLVNDNMYWTEYGFTLWAVESGDGEDIFSSREVTLSKISGDRIAGYGIVICQKMRDGYGQTMLTIMINTTGNYAIGKVVGGNYHHMKRWTHSNFLLQGFGRPNVLGITYDNDEKEYTLVINGHEALRFKDENEPVHEGGRSGYIVVISPQDIFPQNPVEVIFLE
ncbi:MAG: hypothetical protein FWC36_00550 [Spirochaetes bacterium]|nr:hypothetical protein [Spirochaetota bacterium]